MAIGILLDMDGTLVDSMPLLKQSFNETLETEGLHIDKETEETIGNNLSQIMGGNSRGFTDFFLVWRFMNHIDCSILKKIKIALISSKKLKKVANSAPFIKGVAKAIESMKKNKDWKGDQIIDWGAPKHVIGGQISWYITKTYLAPLERFEMLGGDEQDAIAKALSFLAVSKYTRQSPHSWRGYQIYRANREYIQYINPRKPDGTINERKRPSSRNQVLAYEKWQKRLKSINEEFTKRQHKLSEPIRENLFWKIFLGQPQEPT